MGCCVHLAPSSIKQSRLEVSGKEVQISKGAWLSNLSQTLPLATQKGRAVKVWHTPFSTDRQSQACVVGYVAEIV